MPEDESYFYGRNWVDRRGRAVKSKRHARSFHAFENEFPTPTVYEGRTYPSAYHAFQAARYADEHRAPLEARPADGSRAMSAHEARAYGSRADLALLPNFVADRVGIMRAILRAKFTSNQQLLTALLRTGARPLYYDCMCPVWGTCAGRGRNVHGQLLATLRDELRAEVTRLWTAAVQAEGAGAADGAAHASADSGHAGADANVEAT
jgi:predicted NAD-dependent protein-ADP-ribosyltransferase YbiA (DUF1768 family)